MSTRSLFIVVDIHGDVATEIGAVMRRLILLVSALIVPLTAATTVGFAGPAGASPSVQSCAKASGTETGNLTLSKCSGGLGKGSAKATSLATGGTIKWSKGATTFTGTPKSGRGACSKGSTEYIFTGTVTADTSGKVAVGSTVSGKACVSPKGAISFVKHTKFVF